MLPPTYVLVSNDPRLWAGRARLRGQDLELGPNLMSLVALRHHMSLSLQPQNRARNHLFKFWEVCILSRKKADTNKINRKTEHVTCSSTMNIMKWNRFPPSKCCYYFCKVNRESYGLNCQLGMNQATQGTDRGPRTDGPQQGDASAAVVPGHLPPCQGG